MIAWAPTPIPATSVRHGPILIVLATNNSLIVACDDGHLDVTEFTDVSLEVRYDYRTMGWVDVSGLGEDDGDSQEETTDTGGEAIPGDVPEFD